LFSPSYITEVIIRNSEKNETSVRGEKLASGDAFRQKKNYINTAAHFHKTRLQSQQGFAVVKSDLHSMGNMVESRL
jgi:hypothetical protein